MQFRDYSNIADEETKTPEVKWFAHTQQLINERGRTIAQVPKVTR